MKEETYQVYKIVWKNIPITIKHCSNYTNVYKDVYGYHMTHTEIIRDDGKELPMTSSGYRSHFMDERHLEDYSNITEYVEDWLDHEAKSKKWKAYVLDQNQLKLFDFEL